MVGALIDLQSVQAGRADLQARDGSDAAAWWDPESGGLNLKGAQLQSASLSHAVLSHVNLRGADLSGAVARGADLSHTILEQAIFTGADCGGAMFNGSHAGEARFERAMLEDARFEGAALRYADFKLTLLDGAIFNRADLWGAHLDEADADEAQFQKARLDESSLQKGNFSQADFADASLKKARLDGARLQSANFTGARLDGASLRGADLSRASLPRLNLASCDLAHVRLAGAWLENTRLSLDQLGGAVGEERDGDFDAARQAYIALEQNFRSLGDGEGESWAFRKGRSMGKAQKASRARALWDSGDYVACLRSGLDWASDSFVEWLCNYGESLWRVVRAFFTTMLVFAFLYGVTGSLTRAVESAGKGRAITRDPFDMLVFSFTNMLSTSAPDIGLKPANEAVALLVSVQGAVGIVLIGLFGYVLGNRMHR